ASASISKRCRTATPKKKRPASSPQGNVRRRKRRCVAKSAAAPRRASASIAKKRSCGQAPQATDAAGPEGDESGAGRPEAQQHAHPLLRREPADQRQPDGTQQKPADRDDHVVAKQPARMRAPSGKTCGQT